MKKLIGFMLVVSCFFCFVSASGQTVFCQSGGFSLALPDSFAEIPRSSGDDRDLVLHFSDGSVDLTVYVSFSGTGSGFQVLTGDELEYGSVSFGGMDMFYTRGQDGSGSWATYSWSRAQDSVTLYFVWSGNDSAAMKMIREIMSSISFG